MIPVFEQAKTVNALDRAATMIGTKRHKPFKYISCVWPFSKAHDVPKAKSNSVKILLNIPLPIAAWIV
jgi:hypothetical protein